MNTFAEMSAAGQAVGVTEISLALTSFFTVALGGLSIGIIIGFLTALVTKTTSEVRGTLKYPFGQCLAPLNNPFFLS